MTRAFLAATGTLLRRGVLCSSSTLGSMTCNCFAHRHQTQENKSTLSRFHDPGETGSMPARQCQQGDYGPDEPTFQVKF